MIQAKPQDGVTTHAAGCHCGDVRIEFDLDLSKGGSRCNCTVCTKRAIVGAIVEPGAFRLLTPEDKMTGYAWAAKTATFYFCKRCGIPLFGRGDLPQLGGAYVSVNLNCIDGVDPAKLKVVYFDGRHDNWMAGARDVPWPVHGGATA
jgi:hypothetical protein